MSERILEKISQVTEKILNEVKDKTIIISEDKIENVEEFFEKLKQYGVECEKMEIEDKGFYYLIPKCFVDKKRIIGISIGYPEVFYFYSENELESLKKSIEDGILINLVMKSKPLYQIYINNILNEKTKNFFIVPEDDIEFVLLGMKSEQFRRILKSDKIDIRKIGKIYLIAYQTYRKDIPKYAFIEVIREISVFRIEASFNIIPMPKENVIGFLNELYDISKEEFEEILNRNQRLKELVEEILKDEM